MLLFFILGVLLPCFDVTAASIRGIIVALVVVLGLVKLVVRDLLFISNGLTGGKLFLGKGLGLEDLLGGPPLPEVKDNQESEPRPEGGNLKPSALGRVTKRLQEGKRESLMRPEGIGGATINLPNVGSLAPNLFEFVATTGEQTNGEHTKHGGHKECKPLLVVELPVAPVECEADSKAQDDTNHGREGDGDGALTKEEGDEEDAALGNLAPDVPGNVEANGLHGKTNDKAVGAHLLAGIDAEPLGDLERELKDADGGNDLADALDDVGGPLVEVAGEDGEGDGNGDDDQDGNEGGQEGRVGDALEARLKLVLVLIPFRGLLKDGSVWLGYMCGAKRGE